MLRNPLSTFNYYRREKRRSIPIFLALMVAVLGITMMVTLLNSLSDSQKIYYGYLKRSSRIHSASNQTLEPDVITRIKTNEHVKNVYLDRGFSIQVPIMVGNTILNLFAVPGDDVGGLLDLYKARLVKGRLPRPDHNELMVSEEVAKARGLRIGSKIGRDVNKLDRTIAGDFILVGIIESSEAIGFLPYEYLEGDARYSGQGVSLVVVPNENEKNAMDQFLKSTIASSETFVSTYDDFVEDARQTSFSLVVIIGFVDVLIIVVLSIVIGMLNYVFFMQRMGEFAILHALGISKRAINLRVLKEIMSLMGLAWLAGETIAMGLLTWIARAVFEPHGLALSSLDLNAWLFTIPIPVTVALVSIGTVLRSFSRLDPVSIIERRF